MIAPNAAPDYGSSVFAGWRLAAAADWQAYTRHDFVRRLGDGSLPRDAFLHYLVQDYLFRSEEHTSELQSLMRTSYAVVCLIKKNTNKDCTVTILHLIAIKK